MRQLLAQHHILYRLQPFLKLPRVRPSSCSCLLTASTNLGERPFGRPVILLHCSSSIRRDCHSDMFNEKSVAAKATLLFFSISTNGAMWVLVNRDKECFRVVQNAMDFTPVFSCIIVCFFRRDPLCQWHACPGRFFSIPLLISFKFINPY